MSVRFDIIDNNSADHFEGDSEDWDGNSEHRVSFFMDGTWVAQATVEQYYGSYPQLMTFDVHPHYYGQEIASKFTETLRGHFKDRLTFNGTGSVQTEKAGKVQSFSALIQLFDEAQPNLSNALPKSWQDQFDFELLNSALSYCDEDLEAQIENMKIYADVVALENA